MERWLSFLSTIFIAVLGSSGVWAVIMKRLERKDDKTKLLLGLAQRTIIMQCREYCQRGNWITEDEYEDLYEYLRKPYEKLGGNGLAKKWIDRVEKTLQVVPNTYKPEGK